jgi:catechol 2,3-dioxygenase-like lactoylglutathione lyase family enzyme
MIQRNTPELFVRDVEEAIGFYTETLGFQLEGRMPEDRRNLLSGPWS